MITSLTNAAVKRIVLLQSKERSRREEGLYIIEGVRMFMEAPASRIEEVYVTQDFMDGVSDNVRGKLMQTGYELVTNEVMVKMSDTMSPQGVLCAIHACDYSLEDITGKGSLFVILDGLQDPGNLGTIFRTSEAAGVSGIILSRECVSIYNPKSIRSTMGTLFRMPFIYVDDLVDTIGKLHELGIHTYAAHLKGEKSMYEFDYTMGTGFIIGNEGAGISDRVAEAAENYLKIPMEGEVESLNAAVATSVLLYEAHRQRNV